MLVLYGDRSAGAGSPAAMNLLGGEASRTGRQPGGRPAPRGSGRCAWDLRPWPWRGQLIATPLGAPTFVSR